MGFTNVVVGVWFRFLGFTNVVVGVWFLNSHQSLHTSLAWLHPGYDIGYPLARDTALDHSALHHFAAHRFLANISDYFIPGNSHRFSIFTFLFPRTRPQGRPKPCIGCCRSQTVSSELAEVIIT